MVNWRELQRGSIPGHLPGQEALNLMEKILNTVLQFLTMPMT